MNKIFLFSGLVLLLVGCNNVSTEVLNTKKTWVYVELKVITEDTDYYYYFGQVNQSILDKLAMDKGYSSLFVLNNMRYNDDFDKIQEYADSRDDGTMFFRTDDIVKLEVLKHDPLNDTNKKDTINASK